LEPAAERAPRHSVERLVRRAHLKNLQPANAIATNAAAPVTAKLAIRPGDGKSRAVRVYITKASGTVTAATHKLKLARVSVLSMGMKKSMG
jgi:hypothetical protein